MTLCESYTQSIKKPAFNQLEKGCEIELLIKGKKLCGKLELTGKFLHDLNDCGVVSTLWSILWYMASLLVDKHGFLF